MQRGPLTAIIRQQRLVVERLTDFDLTDRQLLDGFVSRRDQAYFAILLWRHAPSVHRVCRSILRDSDDTEDAFQATFAVLARKASSIAMEVPLAGWLHTVAFRIAQRIHARRELRGVTEELKDVFPARESANDSPSREDWSVIKEEMEHLPSKYQAVIRVCYLDGLSNEQAAARIGCPLGTIQSRLYRAREKLREGLARRGFAPAGSANDDRNIDQSPCTH